MQNSKIKKQYEKNCGFCNIPLKWTETPICAECWEALRILVEEKRVDINRIKELNSKKR